MEKELQRKIKITIFAELAKSQAYLDEIFDIFKTHETFENFIGDEINWEEVLRKLKKAKMFLETAEKSLEKLI